MRTKDIKAKFLEKSPENSLKYIPNFLMIIGISNLLLIALVACMRRLFQTDAFVLGVSVYEMLSLIEPYGKLIWEFGLVSLFGCLVIRQKLKQDGLILLVWAFVIMEVQCIYYVSSNYYATMIDTMSDFAGTAAYVSFYTGTHVFKYVLMFMAIVFAIFATGVMLQDKLLLAVAAVMGILYGMCFGIQVMPMIVLPDGSEVGIVIPAALFHVTQTLVVFLTGLYLKLRYQEKQMDSKADIHLANTEKSDKGNMFENDINIVEHEEDIINSEKTDCSYIDAGDINIEETGKKKHKKKKKKRKKNT